MAYLDNEYVRIFWNSVKSGIKKSEQILTVQYKPIFEDDFWSEEHFYFAHVKNLDAIKIKKRFTHATALGTVLNHKDITKVMSEFVADVNGFYPRK